MLPAVPKPSSPSACSAPSASAVDPAGNVFVAGATNQTVAKISTTGVKTTFVSGLNFPFEIALDATGNLYIGHATATTAYAVKVDRTTPPTFNFLATNVGATSTDSPQSVTLENTGNATLNFPKPSTGTNASLSTNFTFYASTTCPRTTIASTLNAGSTCVYAVQFHPLSSGTISGDVTLTDNAPQRRQRHAKHCAQRHRQPHQHLGNSHPWQPHPDLHRRPALCHSHHQPRGPRRLLHLQRQRNPAHHRWTVHRRSHRHHLRLHRIGHRTFIINQATPTLTWPTPAAITYGTALSATQLNATATTPGTFTYTPRLRLNTHSRHSNPQRPLHTHRHHRLHHHHQDRSTSRHPSHPHPHLATPAAISYGTALSATQLNATSTIPGTFTYTPAAGTTPTAGTQTLSVLFTPTDTTDYTTTTKTVQLVVTQATPTITWTTPAAIPYGTALSATQLNATSTTPRHLHLHARRRHNTHGRHPNLSVLFTPTDTTDYTTATKTVQLVVNQATPTITWPTPAAIPYGTALSATQLDATMHHTRHLHLHPRRRNNSPVRHTRPQRPLHATDTTTTHTTTKTTNLTINPAPLAVTAANATRVYGATNPTFTGSLTGAVNNDSLTETFSTSATPSSNVGTYAIVPGAIGNRHRLLHADRDGRNPHHHPGRLRHHADPQRQLHRRWPKRHLHRSRSFLTTGTPTGTVQFLDGANVLNTATLASGTATFTTATLAIGTTASPPSTRATPTSPPPPAPLPKAVAVTGALDFTLSPITTSNDVIPGAAAIYTVQLTPGTGGYPSTVTFAATGLPTGATATFSPSTVASTAGAQPSPSPFRHPRPPLLSTSPRATTLPSPSLC